MTSTPASAALYLTDQFGRPAGGNRKAADPLDGKAELLQPVGRRRGGVGLRPKLFKASLAEPPALRLDKVRWTWSWERQKI